MRRSDPVRTIGGIAAARAGFGAALALATPALLRTMVPSETPSGSFTMFARTVGIRNFAFGLGALHASRSGAPDDIRRWIAAWLVSDVADIAAGVASSERLGRRGAAIAALTPLPFAVAGLWAWRSAARR